MIATDSPVPPVVMSIPAAGKYLDVSADTVRRLVRKGDIQHARIGHSIRIRQVDLDSYVTGQLSCQWRRMDGRGRKPG